MKRSFQNSKKKGYYAEKIAESQTDLKPQIEWQNTGSSQKEKKIKKTAKEIAKEARERKKTYIIILQSKIEELTKKNENLEKTIQSLVEDNEKLRAALKKDENNFDGLIPEFQQLYRVLQMQNQVQISRSLSILRDKYGIAGRERAKSISNQFDKILEKSIPMHFRLLMENCEDNHKFYSLLGINNRIKEFVKLGEKQKQILVKVRPQIIKHKEVYDGIFNDLSKIKQRLYHVNHECQHTVDKIEDGLTPQFVGRLLIDLDFYRSQQNLDNIYPINYWDSIKEQGGYHYQQSQMKIIEEQLSVRAYDNANFMNDLEIFDSLFG